MTRLATLTIDAESVSVSRSLAALARASARDGGPLICVSHRALDDLAAELGGYEAAAGRLLRIATQTARPICVNLPTGPETSMSVFVAPKTWSEDRLRGWAAGRHAELESVFGAATIVPLEEL